MAALTDFELVAPGADFAAKLAASGDDALVAMPQEFWVVTTLDTTEFAKGPSAPGFEQWPLWALSVIVARAYQESATLTLFATDSVVTPHKIKETLEDAESTGFLSRAEGRVSWTALDALANDLAEHAARQRELGNLGPYQCDDNSFLDFQSAAIPQGHRFNVLNHLMARDLRNQEGMPVGLLRLPVLFYPYTSGPADFGDGTDAAIVLAHVIHTAAATFASLNATSQRLAVARLLNVPVPYQLVLYSTDVADRVAFVDMLAAWAKVSERPAVMQEHFSRILKTHDTLDKWVRTSLGPFQKASQLMRALGCDAYSLEIESFVILDKALRDCDDVWRDEVTADQNITYLLTTLGKQPGKRATGGDDAPDGVRVQALHGEVVRRAAKLVTDLEKWAEDTDRSDFAAIELIYAARVSKPIKFLLGKVAVASLPPIYALSCETLPSKLDEFVIDTLKHDDAGRLDPTLEDLTVRALYTLHASTSRSFFQHLEQGEFLAISWDKDFILPLLSVLQPGETHTTFAMRDVYGDSDRWLLHRTFVSRALAAVGKPASANNSFDAICDEWQRDLAQARLGGDALKQDFLDQTDMLMRGVWASADSKARLSLSTGTSYPEELFDGSASEVQSYRTFVRGLPAVRALATKYTRTLGKLVAAAAPTEGTSNTRIHPAAAPRVVAAGSRINSVRTGDDGFACHTAYGEHWFNVEKCEAFVKSTFKVANVCVMTGLAPFVMNVPGMSAKQLALTFCSCQHKLDAPEHKLAHRCDLFEAVCKADGCYERRQNLRKKAVVAGDTAAIKARSPRKPFRGQAAGK